MLNTEIKTIPHNHQRYPTCGDYYYDFSKTIIHVSDMKNEKYEFLIAIHEQIEEFLTRLRGIKEEHITEFDKDYENQRKDGDYKEHLFATIVEKLVAIELDVNWEDYEKAIINLDEPTNTGC